MSSAVEDLTFHRTAMLHSEMSDYIRSCRRTGLFTDVRLFGSDPSRPIDIHGMILSGVSPIVRNLCPEPSEGTVTTLVLPDVEVDDLQRFVEKLYEADSIALPADDELQDIFMLFNLGFVSVNGIKQENVEVLEDHYVKEENFYDEMDLKTEAEPLTSKGESGKPKKRACVQPKAAKSKKNVKVPPANIVYHCEKCNTEFTGLKTFVEHSKSSHGLEEVICCHFCPLILTSLTERMEHEKATHPNYPNACPVCGNSFSSQRGLNDHMRKRHPGKKKEIWKKMPTDKDVKCKYCDQIFRSLSGRKKHVYKYHPEKPKILPKNREIKRSTCRACKGRHEDGICCVCKQTFHTVNWSTAYRTRQVHEHVKKQHSCHFCDKVFLKTEEREEHLKTEHGESLFRACHYCGKQVKTDCMKSHLKYQHESGLDYSCDECGESFKYPQYLKQHKILTHASKEEKAAWLKKQQAFCGLCGKMFYDKKALRKHTLHVHLKIKAFKCSICHGDFVTKQSMQNHMRSVHRGHNE